MNSSNAFRIRIFLFCCYSYGIETINTLIHERSRSFLENHTRFQNKMSKVFSDQKKPKNPTLWGGTYLYSLYEGVSPLVLTPFMIESMGVENSIFVRLMIQRTGMHTSIHQEFLGVYNLNSRVLVFSDLLLLSLLT